MTGDEIGSGSVVAGRYRLVEPIGSGGMGVVWRASDQDGGTVALKQVRLDPVASQHERTRTLALLRREADVAAAVSGHPNVVSVHGCVEHDGEPWLVMDLVDGTDLAGVVSRDGPLAPARAATVGSRLAAALRHLHAAGVVHGDVTPRNVLLGADDAVVLTDFGISRVESEQTLSTLGRPAGVPAFFAPEIAQGRRATTATDVFGLGAVLHHALEGAGPWGRGEERTLFARATHGVAGPGPSAGPLKPVLAWLLRRRPADRPTARQAAAALDAVAAGRRPHTRPATRALVTAGAAVVVGVLVAAVVLWPAPQVAPTSALSDGLGDARTVDPCGLLEAQPLARFGDATLEPEYGNFDRCDVTVDGPSQMVVTALLDDTPPTGPPAGPRVDVGGVPVLSPPVLPGDRCSRFAPLPGGTQLVVTARLDDGPSPDLCAVADAAMRGAAARLASGPVPRRAAFEPASLGSVDACGLLTPAETAAVPGLQRSTATPGFGHWSCTWRGSEVDGADIDVDYDRDVAGLQPDDGRPVETAGHPARARVDDDRSCVVRIEHRPFTQAGGDTAYELLDVEVTQARPVPDPCAAAEPVAAAAAARLPPR